MYIIWNFTNSLGMHWNIILLIDTVSCIDFLNLRKLELKVRDRSLKPTDIIYVHKIIYSAQNYFFKANCSNSKTNKYTNVYNSASNYSSEVVYLPAVIYMQIKNKTKQRNKYRWKISHTVKMNNSDNNKSTYLTPTDSKIGRTELHFSWKLKRNEMCIIDSHENVTKQLKQILNITIS